MSIRYIQRSELLAKEDDLRCLPNRRDSLPKQREAWDFADFAPEKAELPTAYPPGSDGKVVVMMTRAILGQEIWHNDDACGLPRDDDSDADDQDPTEVEIEFDRFLQEKLTDKRSGVKNRRRSAAQ